MARRRRRSGRPRSERPYRCNASQRIVRNRSALLETINGFYAKALDLLPVEEMPALVPRLLKAGLCVGFSDPVSNIIVNTVSYCRRVPHRKSLHSGKTKMGARKKALSRAVADTSDVKYWPPFRPLLRDMPVAVRSLEALLAFLTYYFRYLPVSEALEYLRLAKGDLLTAVRMILLDRCSIDFRFASRTTKTALKCAALAAWHPKPRALVNRSYSLASRVEKVSRHLHPTDSGFLSCSAIETINKLLIKPRYKRQSLAVFIPPQFIREMNVQEPFVFTKSLRSILLDKIYGYYLYALKLLPPINSSPQLYHQALLKAGHCYGPANVSLVFRILINTLWYKTTFPLQDNCSVAMICSRSLVRLACRSLRGLIAYLCTRFPMMSEHQAMYYLLDTDVRLQEAVEMAIDRGHAEISTLDQHSAYFAAATAAQHPDPGALVDFFVSTFPRMPDPLPSGVPELSEMLIQCCSATRSSVQEVAVLSEGGSKVLSLILRDFQNDESFAVQKVLAALRKYEEQTKESCELHTICGLNSNIGNSYVFGLHYGPGHLHPRKSQYSHINFLATPKGYPGTVPILFFAECSNDEDVTDEHCYPVRAPPGRCFYCENEGAKIVHPAETKYIGSDIAFERMACEDLGGLTVDDSGDKLIAHCADICEEDCIYFDANRDVKCAEFLNARAGIFQRSFLV
ncbi:unnamed protein product [Urochloa humidicola]